MIISEFCKAANIDFGKFIGVQNSSQEIGIDDESFITKMSKALHKDTLISTYPLSKNTLDFCNLLNIYSVQDAVNHKKLFIASVRQELEILKII